MAKHDTEWATALRAARDAAGLTQAQVAEAVGRHAQTVAHWEQGVQAPDPLAQAEILRRIEGAAR